MHFPWLKSLSAVLAAAFLFTNADARSWTDKKGRTIDADFVSTDGTNVTLKLTKTGKTATVPIDSLSPKDVAFVNEQETQEPVDSADVVDMPDRWPEKVPGPKNFRLKEENAKDKNRSTYVYKTANFRFTSQKPLDEKAQEAIGRLYEGTFAAVKRMPLPIPRVKSKRRPGQELKALLTPDMASYYAAGGPQGSVGVFRSAMAQTNKRLTEKDVQDDMTIVPFTALGISPDGKLLDDKIDSHTLAHEITHQLTCLCNFRNSIWINEGMSEYVGYVPYDGNEFDFTGAFKNIREAALLYEQHGKWTLPFTIEEFIDMSQDTFYGKGSTDPNYGHRNYTLAAMLVAYHFHLDDRYGLRNFTNYMNALQRGTAPDKCKKTLLGKRKNFKQLQDDFSAAWKEKGVNIQFKE